MFICVLIIEHDDSDDDTGFQLRKKKDSSRPKRLSVAPLLDITSKNAYTLIYQRKASASTVASSMAIIIIIIIARYSE